MTTIENFEIWDESKTVPSIIINADSVEVKKFEVWIDETIPYLDIRDVSSYRNPPFIM